MRESILHKSAAAMHEPLSNAASSGWTSRGIIAKVRRAVRIEIPTGYQDETGFHKGIKPVEKEIKWPPVW